ncbi:hypothetical protein Q1695_002451 [Nippostrongylus brasiliensis]|nr:hypothetical protein Q1695_002451 [Nippostrongylus brasiliensis]
MIDYTIFECEIEPTLEKGVAEIRQRKDDKPSSKISPCSLTRDHRLQSIRKHLEQVYEVDRALLWKMSHCTAQSQMSDILDGLKVVRVLEKAIQRRLFDTIRETSEKTL